MAPGSTTRVFVMGEDVTLSNVRQGIWQRLTRRLHVHRVDSVEECDVVLAFVTVVSRAGTDIQAALRIIPTSRPAVLMVFHHTFDADYIAPQSQWFVNREDTLALDFLCHEDVGLLKCLANDIALKSMTDHLIRVSRPDTHNMPPVSPASQLLPRHPSGPWRNKLIIVLFFLFVVVLVVFFLVYYHPWKGPDHTSATVMPDATVTTQQLSHTKA